MKIYEAVFRVGKSLVPNRPLSYTLVSRTVYAPTPHQSWARAVEMKRSFLEESCVSDVALLRVYKKLDFKA